MSNPDLIHATYFDGQGTTQYPVVLLIHKGILAIRGDCVSRSAKLSQLAISERLSQAPRILRFPDDGFIQVWHPALDRLLAKNGYRDPWVVRWQHNWPLSLVALLALLAMLLASYQWGLPWAAGQLARITPASVAKKIGDEELKLIDAQYMSPTQLDPVDRARLKASFAALKLPQSQGSAMVYELVFRHSNIGPNAFALPNGTIILTDQLVMLARNDPAVLAVLAHELGHLQQRHSLRRVFQTVGVGVAIHFMLGDVSTALAALPTFLLDQKYSRDFEREADQYAIDMMHANRLPLAPMADLFEKMHTAERRADQSKQDEQQHAPGSDKAKGKRKEKAVSPLEYFSSHPSDDERIARLKAADRR
ncbi:M48 family metallopeptidase [Undibacterium arcticum]|uniref:M48 family metallopeptidase n=1 Tax=Undibacterium arcticum TaxID=1762892 RepID=A0ABV7EYK5_9BURK